jgi:hypothetical protein
MYLQDGDHPQKSGRGGDGCRGANGKVSVTFIGDFDSYTWEHLNQTNFSRELDH